MFNKVTFLCFVCTAAAVLALLSYKDNVVVSFFAASGSFVTTLRLNSILLEMDE